MGDVDEVVPLPEGAPVVNLAVRSYVTRSTLPVVRAAANSVRVAVSSNRPIEEGGDGSDTSDISELQVVAARRES